MKGLILGCIIQWKMLNYGVWIRKEYYCIILLFVGLYFIKLVVAHGTKSADIIFRITYICVKDYSGKDNLNFQLIRNNDLIIV